VQPPIVVVTHQATGKTQTSEVPLDKKLTMGRDPAGPIVLEGRKMSRAHLTLWVDNGRVMLQDLSRNGTFLNGALCTNGVSVALAVGDLIEVPGYRIEVLLPVEEVPPLPPAQSELVQKAESTVPLLKPIRGFLHSVEGAEILVFVTAIFSVCLIVFYTLL
jgi:pSer/pThr/pTyr-binding forkhead associated (FHA) protein